MPASITPPWTIDEISDGQTDAATYVRSWLREHNMSKNPEFMRALQHRYESSSLTFIARMGEEPIGGIIAEVQLSWLRIGMMAVHDKYRGLGVGKGLLQWAEKVAVKRGCRYAYVSTMSYQGPQFYVSRGYQVVGEIPDWDSHGNAKFHLTKTLA